MSPTKYHRQRPRTDDGETEELEDEEADAANASDPSPSSTTLEDIVEEMIDTRLEQFHGEIEALERQVEEVDNFARISLNERKVKQNEVKLSEFSESLTAFAEKAFQNLNELERRLDMQALLLASILESMEDVDLGPVHRHRSEELVMDATPEERLAAAIDAAGGDRPVEES